MAVSNGHASLGEGSDAGILGIACTGASPRGGGPPVPGQVVTELGAADTRLRIMRNDGVPITGTVQINCAVEVIVTPVGEGAVERLRDAATAG
ncbi:MAG: hypothetical protein ACRD07_19650 [Acidimicrobiales bacterium]